MEVEPQYYGSVGVLDFVLRLLAMVSDLWEAAVICLILSLGVTQWIKSIITSRVSQAMLAQVLQTIAFVSAAVPMLLLHPTPRGAILGAAVGVASPLIYRFALFLVWKRWPRLGHALSADSPTFSFSDFLQGRQPSRPSSGGDSRCPGSSSPEPPKKRRKRAPSR
jgi:hypothetical protein